MTAGRERSVSGDGVLFASVKAALQIAAKLHPNQQGNIDGVLLGMTQH